MANALGKLTSHDDSNGVVCRMLIRFIKKKLCSLHLFDSRMRFLLSGSLPTTSFRSVSARAVSAHEVHWPLSRPLPPVTRGLCG
jgi:hypothetical protein